MDFDSLSLRHLGGTAQGYDRSRENSRQWANEQAAVEMFFEKLPKGISVVDIPVGTGRFVEIYQRRNLIATGIDASHDMLQIAEGKIEKIGFKMALKVGDIRSIDEPDDSYDVAVRVRFLNWIGDADVSIAVRELTRVSRSHLILGARHLVPVGEVRLFSMRGLGRFSRQLLRRVKSRIVGSRSPKIVVHRKSRLTRVLPTLDVDLCISRVESVRLGHVFEGLFLINAPTALLGGDSDESTVWHPGSPSVDFLTE